MNEIIYIMNLMQIILPINTMLIAIYHVLSSVKTLDLGRDCGGITAQLEALQVAEA